jgi:hypothetical protein
MREELSLKEVPREIVEGSVMESRLLVRPFIVSALVGLSAPAWAERAEAPQAPPSLSALLSQFAAMPGLEARFREEKRIALLAAPLVSEGSLHFAPPGRLARHTESPMRASVVVSGGVLRFGDGTSSERLDLASNPTVRLFTESFLALFAGDEQALRRLYTMSYTPMPSGDWELQLTPREARLSRVVRQVVVRGHGVILERMRVAEVSGDETVTTFTAVNTARRYGETEIRRIFRVATPRASERGR